jgi:peptidoglycan/LPS O-acetylase OafA/YrhL
LLQSSRDFLVTSESTTISDPSVSTAAPVAPVNPVAMTAAKTSERFHQLDGLRAVAVGLVFFHHSFSDPIAQWLGRHGSWYLAKLLLATTGSGVELFFVLSGVVLLRPYLRGSRPFKPGQYFRRRIERLWPPYLVALFLEGILHWLTTYYPTWFTEGLSQAKFSLGSWARQVGIISFGWNSYNVAWWSLSIEVLFYLLVPLVIPLFSRRFVSKFIMAIVLVGSLFLGLVVLRTIDDNHPVVYDTFQRFAVYSACFLLGMAIAKFDWSPRTGAILVVVGLIWLLSAIGAMWRQLPTLTATSPFPRDVINYHAGYGLLYAGLVMVSFRRDSRLYRFLSSDLMVWLGERSYSIFLIHFTVFVAVNYLVSFIVFERDWSYLFLTRAIGLPGALLAAMVMFQTVERRFARGLVTADKFWPPL